MVGDLNGTSADPAFTDAAAGLLRELAFTVAMNEPDAGGRIVRNLGDPAAGVHSIQIEINRRLYLDEPHAARSDRFLAMRADLERFTRRLAQAARAGGSQRRLRPAALQSAEIVSVGSMRAAPRAGR